MNEELLERNPSSQANSPPLSDVQYNFYKYNLNREEYADAKEYLFSRGFTEETIEKYNIGAGV